MKTFIISKSSKFANMIQYRICKTKPAWMNCQNYNAIGCQFNFTDSGRMKVSKK